MVDPIKIIKGIQEVENIWGDFIQNGPSDGIGGYVRDQYRKRCDQFANLPGWARQLSSPATGSFQRACQPYWNDQGTDGPISQPPFNGGQCECELYSISYRHQGTSEQFGTPFDRSGSFKARGPISGPRPNINNNGFVINARSPRTSSGAADPVCGDVREIIVDQVLFPTNDNQLTEFNVTSLASVPGNCGDPPGDLQPGPNPPADPGPTPGPEPTDDPFGGPIPVVPIPPYNDPIFGPTPILEPSDGEPPASQPAGGDGLPGDPDAVGGPAGGTGTDGEGEDIDFGPPPPGRVWVGALIENTVDPRYGNIPGTGPENTVYPYVIGNASLRYSGGRSSSSRMRSRWHDIYRPVTALEVIGCFVQCRPGVSAVVRPVSAIICPENPCEETEDG